METSVSQCFPMSKSGLAECFCACKRVGSDMMIYEFAMASTRERWGETRGGWMLREMKRLVAFVLYLAIEPQGSVFVFSWKRHVQSHRHGTRTSRRSGCIGVYDLLCFGILVSRIYDRQCNRFSYLILVLHSQISQLNRQMRLSRSCHLSSRPIRQ